MLFLGNGLPLIWLFSWKIADNLFMEFQWILLMVNLVVINLEPSIPNLHKETLKIYLKNKKVLIRWTRAMKWHQHPIIKNTLTFISLKT